MVARGVEAEGRRSAAYTENPEYLLIFEYLTLDELQNKSCH
jgi:hypothetical protein